MEEKEKMSVRDWYHSVCYFSDSLYSMLPAMGSCVASSEAILLCGCTVGWFTGHRDFIYYGGFLCAFAFYINVFACAFLAYALYSFLRVYKTFCKGMLAEIVLLREDGTVFDVEEFHDAIVYAVPLEFTESQEFAECALYLTDKIGQVLNEPCPKYERIWKSFHIFMELGRCRYKYGGKYRNK